MPKRDNRNSSAIKALHSLILAFILGCTATKHSPELPPLYQAPSNVAVADRKECEERAKSSTQDLNQKILEKWDENFLVQSSINAAVGALSGFWRLPKRPSNKVATAGRRAYESVMKSCLKAKGYSL